MFTSDAICLQEVSPAWSQVAQGCLEAAQRFRDELPSSLAPTQAHSSTFVVAGDFNLQQRHALTRIRFMPFGPEYFTCDSEHKNDRILANVLQTPGLPGPLARDKKHRALRALLELAPAQTPVVGTASAAEDPLAPAQTPGEGTMSAAEAPLGAPAQTRGAEARTKARSRATQVLQGLYSNVAEQLQKEQQQQQQELEELEEQAEVSQSIGHEQPGQEAGQEEAGEAKADADMEIDYDPASAEEAGRKSRSRSSEKRQEEQGLSGRQQHGSGMATGWQNMLLPCYCHAIAMLLPCYCHVIAILLPSMAIAWQ